MYITLFRPPQSQLSVRDRWPLPCLGRGCVGNETVRVGNRLYLLSSPTLYVKSNPSLRSSQNLKSSRWKTPQRVRDASTALGPQDRRQCPDLHFMELITQSVLFGDTPHYDWLASPMTIRIPVPWKGTLVSGMQRYIWWAFSSRQEMQYERTWCTHRGKSHSVANPGGQMLFWGR